jgi:hypothetical protein
MPSAAGSISLAATLAPIALCCVMHQSIAADAASAHDRRDRDIERLSISARSQLMSFARAMWLREQAVPTRDACLWRLWESDWTALRRTSVPNLPAWCRAITGDVAATDGRTCAITFLHAHTTAGFELAPTAVASSPEAPGQVAAWVAVRAAAPLMPSPSLAIQQTIEQTAAIEVTVQASARLARTSILETDAAVSSLGVVSGIGGLLD